MERQKLKLLSIKKSTKAEKKLMATFERDGAQIVRHFGATGYSDYTKHKDAARKQRYIDRHRGKEDWRDPTTPGALSRFVLWNKPSLRSSVADFRKRFNLA